MLTDIGTAVATERKRQGLAIEDLGLDPALVRRVESGAPGLTTVELEAVALALQVDPLAMRRGEVVARPRPGIYLRHRAIQDFDARDAAILDDGLEHARARIALAKSIGVDPGIAARSAIAARPIACDTAHAPAVQGYKLARELRIALDNVAAPLGDLRVLAEETLGVTVLVRELATLGATAVSVKAGDAAAIVLTPGTAGSLVRVWIAHELCHVLYDPDVEGLHLAVDFVADRRVVLVEQRARAFAAEFLVPKAGLRELLGRGVVRATDAARQSVERAQERFGATWQVTANQVCNQGFVDPGLREWLEGLTPVARGASVSTSLPTTGGPSVQLRSVLARAYDLGVVTDAEARALLGLDIVDPLPWDVA